MRVTVYPAKVAGTLQANPSKSHAQRALTLAAMANGRSQISNISWSDDVIAAAGVCSKLCTSVAKLENSAVIDGGLMLQDDTWHCGEAGFSLRMFTAIAGLFEQEITLTGEGSLLERPVEFMRGPIEALGAHFSSHSGHLPITIRGRMKAGELNIDGSLSSQFLSGLLMALPTLDGDSTLHVHDLKSTPYIDLSIRTMAQFGVAVEHKEHTEFTIPGRQTYQPRDLRVEGDWSGMAFLLVAGALAGSVHVVNLNMDSTQSDKAIMDVLASTAVQMDSDHTGIRIRKSGLKPFMFDATDAPDLFPPLVSLAAHCDGISKVSGVHRLTHKESDRYATLHAEFGKLGIEIWQEEDTMCIKGGQPHGGVTRAHGDHRIAMALATTALHASGPVTIDGAQCVAKSFPDFFTHLAAIGTPVESLE